MEEGASGMDRLKSRLYSPAVPAGLARQSVADSVMTREKTVWPKGFSPRAASAERVGRDRSRWLTRVLFVALVFFLGAVAFAAWVVFRGDNWVSSTNVDIEVSGPTEISSGGELLLEVVVTNRNQAALQDVRLLGEYPEGTRSPAKPSEPLPRSVAAIGPLASGESSAQTVRAIIFGEKGSTQLVKLVVEYRLPGSGAIFDRTKSYPVKINSSPVSLNFSVPETTNAGDEITLVAELLSGSESPVTNLVLVANYPPGFNFKKSTPAPTSGNGFWRLGDLAPGAKREVRITGVLAGEDEETKSFRLTTGLEDPATEGTTSLVYGSLFKLVTLRRTAVALDFVLNGSRGETLLATSNESLRGDFGFLNNLAEEIRNASLEVEFSGAGLNRGGVSVPEGFYDSSRNRIVWTKKDKPALAALAPGGGGNVSFGFSGDALVPTPGGEPRIDLVLRFRGERITADGPEEVNLTLERTVKFKSLLQLSAKIVHGSGPFLERGSLPPRAGSKITYTVVWSVANSPSAVAEARVRARLPTYVSWLGQISPADEAVTYDEASGEVVWNLGLVEAGRGFSTSPRQMAFQIEFTPSLSQVGSTPDLISEAVLTGTDRFTGAVLESKKPALNTFLLQEPSFHSGDERVSH